MTFSTESQKTIDAYLVGLRKQLRGPVDADVEDIVEEIRAHILDKTSGARRRTRLRQHLLRSAAPRNSQADTGRTTCCSARK